MDAQTSEQTSSILHRVFRARRGAAVSSATPRLKLLASQAIAMALVSASLALAEWGIHRGLVGTVTRVSYRIHWYHVPLSILAHLTIFALGFSIVAMMWIRPRNRRWLDPIATTVGWFVAFLSPMLAIEELYWPCSVVLASALAIRVAPWWMRNRSQVLRKTLPAVAAVAACLFVGGMAWQGSSETRAQYALPPARSNAPNVVLLVLDTVRADHLSLHGYARDTSPTMKSLADRAVVFDFARAPAPWTLPSHATMFTGRWPHELSVDIDRGLDRTYPTLAEVLSQNGYATAGFTGNVFYNNAWFGLDRGFSHYEDVRENQTLSIQEMLRCSSIGRVLIPLAVRAKIWHTTGQYPVPKRAEEIRDDAMSWIDGRKANRPFYLFMNYYDAHDPYRDPDAFPVKYSWEDRAAVHQAYKQYTGHAAPDDARHQIKHPADSELTQIMMDAYDDCIRYVDDQIAKLFANLKARGLDQNTWVIITADHGEQFGEHGHHRHGGSLYRSAIDVPLLIIPPSGSNIAATRVGDPVSPRDLPATVADLAGLASSSPFPGNSLRAYWDRSAKSSASKDIPLSELKIPANHLKTKGATGIDLFKAALVDRNHVYHRSPIDPEELYDVNDRPELDNLAPRPEHSQTLDALRPRIDAIRNGTRSP